VKEALATTDLSASTLELEITETAALTDFSMALKKLNALRELDIKLSLDDFGTGYSSLSYLHKLPVQVLKIDQSFVRDLLTDKTKRAITRSTINLAHHIGLHVIAEGVESRDHMQILSKWQCDQIQGYLLAKPMPFSELLQFIDKHNPADWIAT